MLRRSLALAAGLALAVPSTAAAADQDWIVVLQDGADSAAVAQAHGNRPAHTYTAALKGYAASFSATRAAQLRRDPRVKAVEPDRVATASAQTTPWGVTKVGADPAVTVTRTGAYAYVLDSGIAKHPDLRVAGHVNFAGGKNTDCDGHGTHVAGTIAALHNGTDVVGVAPSATLTGVKVLNCDGSGTYSGIIAGVDWVTRYAKRPAVANMSLGGPASDALDSAVRKSVASGITYVVAAGNDGIDASMKSPARAGTTDGVITVGATDQADARASFSNFGASVDLWAPGVAIPSTRLGGGTTSLSGTSMASPHVAGGAALVLAGAPLSTPAQVEAELEAAAVADAPAGARLSVSAF